MCLCVLRGHAQVVDTSVADLTCCCSPLVSSACLHPAAHLTRLSATQDQRASPLRGGGQAEPQHAHQQHLAGLTLAYVPSCFWPPEFISVRQAEESLSVIQPLGFCFVFLCVFFFLLLATANSSLLTLLAAFSGSHGNQPADGRLVRHSHREWRYESSERTLTEIVKSYYIIMSVFICTYNLSFHSVCLKVSYSH